MGDRKKENRLVLYHSSQLVEYFLIASNVCPVLNRP